jgi:ribosomal protein S27AE
MSTWAKAAKNYQMKPCPRCDGHGRGVTKHGARWSCDHCDATGKVSIYPPQLVVQHDKRGNWIGPVANENGWTP